MKIKLMYVKDRGDLERERIVMRATSKVDVGQYALIEAGFEEDSVNVETGSCYWFSDQVIEKNDWVVLYTKSGENKEKLQKSGATAYFYYWDKKKPKWNTSSKVPVVLEVDSWDFIAPEKNT